MGEKILFSDLNQATQAAIHQAARPIARSQQRLRVLLVDDDPAILESLTAILSLEFEVASCSSAEDALQVLRELEADVVVSDWQMQGMDGIAFIEAIQLKKISVSCLLLTGNDQACSQQLVNRKGIMVLSKSVPPATLMSHVQMLGNVCRSKRLAKSLFARV